MSEPSLETTIALIKAEQERVEIHLTATDARILELQKERNNALVWGIIVLGTATIAMGTWIFQFFAGRIH